MLDYAYSRRAGESTSKLANFSERYHDLALIVPCRQSFLTHVIISGKPIQDKESSIEDGEIPKKPFLELIDLLAISQAPQMWTHRSPPHSTQTANDIHSCS
jgi:hypothetical protein